MNERVIRHCHVGHHTIPGDPETVTTIVATEAGLTNPPSTYAWCGRCRAYVTYSEALSLGVATSGRGGTEVPADVALNADGPNVDIYRALK